jgi:hypothetical protein
MTLGQADLSTPAGNETMKSAHLYNCLIHSVPNSLGHMNTCVESCRLMSALLNCSSAVSAAAGAGDQRNIPLLTLFLQKPCLSQDPPSMSCPRRCHPVGDRTSISDLIHDRNHLSHPGCLSRADWCSGTNDNMSPPAATPSFKLPRETPSVPCAIILFPFS